MAATIDFNHPLYLHPSDTPGIILVSHQLVGIDNYNVWSRFMRIALLAKNKLSFVDGDSKKEDYAEELQSQWERCNAIVLSWILNSVSKELSARIVFASNAAFVWKDLKERFDKVDGSRVYFLHREITTLHQGEMTISTYFTRLKLLWDEYHTLVPFSTCECEISQDNLKHLIQQRLFQFLMGLNETYSAIRFQILLMQPLPSVNQAYSMFVQEESQRTQLSGLAPFSEATVMLSTTGGGTDRRQFNGLCDFCKIRGHKKENCYRLIGYPADFKFTRKKGPSGSMAASSSITESDLVFGSTDSPGVLSVAAPSFTSEQYSQILNLLNKVSSVDSSANIAGYLRWKDEGDW